MLFLGGALDHAIVLGTVAFKKLASLLLCATACSSHIGNGAGASPSPPPPTIYCGALPVDNAFCHAVIVATPKASLRLALAGDPASRARGLMGVRSIRPDQGMIFVFPDVRNVERYFWMKDTVVPLDMIFINTDGIVTEIDENVAATKPGTPDARVARRRGVGRIVIELRAGDAEGAGLEPGMRLAIPDLPAR